MQLTSIFLFLGLAAFTLANPVSNIDTSPEENVLQSKWSDPFYKLTEGHYPINWSMERLTNEQSDALRALQRHSAIALAAPPSRTTAAPFADTTHRVRPHVLMRGCRSVIIAALLVAVRVFKEEIGWDWGWNLRIIDEFGKEVREEWSGD